MASTTPSSVSCATQLHSRACDKSICTRQLLSISSGTVKLDFQEDEEQAARMMSNRLLYSADVQASRSSLQPASKAATSSAQVTGKKRPSRGHLIVSSTFGPQPTSKTAQCPGKSLGERTQGGSMLETQSTGTSGRAMTRPLFAKTRSKPLHRMQLSKLPRADCAIAVGSQVMLNRRGTNGGSCKSLGVARSGMKSVASGRDRWLSQSTSHSQLYLLRHK